MVQKWLGFLVYCKSLSRRTHKCSPPSCFRYTALGNDVQSPIYLDEGASLAPLSKLPRWPWIFEDKRRGYGLWETFCIPLWRNSWETDPTAHSFQPCDYPGSHEQLQRDCFKPFSRLANSSHSMIFLICGPTKIPALTFALESFGKRSWRYLEAADSLSRAVTNCLVRPNLMLSSLGTGNRWHYKAVQCVVLYKDYFQFLLW